MIRMEPQLRPPQAPMLRYAHLEMFAERFPQQRKEADYAIAGGAAVMLLLEAASVEGYDVADSTADNRRMHKDLEIYAFKHVFSYLNRNAHDLAFLSDANNFCRVDYRREPPEAELVVEILRGYYYDFMLPQEQDATAITTQRGNRFWVLKPEFAIASKIFSANGMRQGIDDEDALALLKRFKINEEYLCALLRRSEFAEVFQFESAAGLITGIESGSFYECIGKKVEEKYGADVPEIIGLPYSEKVSALRYSISELALNPGQAALLSREADNFMRLCLRYAASNLNSGLDNCIAGLQKSAGKDRHFALATASALKQTLGLLKQCSGAEYDALAGRIVRKVLETDYVHVLTSALRQRLAERIAQGARSVDYKQLVKGF